MSTNAQIQSLQAQLASLETIRVAEEIAAEAKAAYQADPDDEDAKAAHREAATALAAARQEKRATPVVVATGDGSTTVMPAPAGSTPQEG